MAYFYDQAWLPISVLIHPARLLYVAKMHHWDTEHGLGQLWLADCRHTTSLQTKKAPYNSHHTEHNHNYQPTFTTSKQILSMCEICFESVKSPNFLAYDDKLPSFINSMINMIGS